ncbi:MAG TPA: phosphodiester glycosidase family protein [Kofleriaceae bacterium]
MRGPWLFLLLVACGREAGVASGAATLEPTPALAEAAAAGPPSPCSSTITKLGPGLTAEQAGLLGTPAAGPPCVDIVRADLAHHRLRVLTAARDGRSQPAPTWRETFRLIAVTNAGMFHASGTPVALIIEDGVPLSKDNKKYLGYLAFDPRSPADAPIIFTGRDCENYSLDDLRKRYRSIVQSPRLLGCTGEALPWQDKKQYSAAAIGFDRAGRVVFVHARGAVTMSELSNTLASLDLTAALFLEGGPEASLVVRGSEAELLRMGSYETNFVENDTNQSFWWLPNVIGLEAQGTPTGKGG